MILGCPRAKQGLCHTKHGGAGGIILWALLTVFLVLVKVLFSDNNSDVFEWFGTLIDIYVMCSTNQEL